MQPVLDEIEVWLGEALSDHEKDDIVRRIGRGLGMDNGYDLAKEMEGLGYEPDAQLVDILDSAVFHLYSVENRKLAEWVVASGARPKLKVGDRVKVRKFLADKTLYDGEIVSIDEKQGKYTVFSEALGHVRPPSQGALGIVHAWEDVEADNPSPEGP
jgi:hypothetical protein